MRHFIRVLRFSWAYRLRLMLSVLCAVGVSAFWGLNLSAIYPVLLLLSKGQNLHQWVDTEIEAYRKKANNPELVQQSDDLERDVAELDRNPLLPDWENTRRRKVQQLTHIRGELQNAGLWEYRYRLLKSRVMPFVPEDKFHSFVFVIVFVVVGVTIKGVFDFFQEILVGSVVNRSLFDLRNRFYRSVLHQDLRQLGDAGTTDLMARFTNDVEQLGTGMKTLYGRMVVEPLKAVACVIFACWISWQLTLVFLILVPLALVTLMKLSKMMRRAAKKLLEHMSDVYKILRETFDGAKVVKAFTMEPYERLRFRKATEEYYQRSMQVLRIDSFAGPMVELLGVIALGVALSAGAYLVLTGERRIFGMNMSAESMHFPSLLLLYAYLVSVADPVRKLSSVYTKISAGVVAAERVFSVMDDKPAVRPNADVPHLPRHDKAIEFRNVCFSYVPGIETLSGITLTVKAGETIAFVGPNGCGKSTLLGLLPRFYDPDHGAVLVDGVNLRTANLRSLRKQIGLVTQDTVLFEDTVFNNIVYGKPGASREEVEAAAKRAFAHEFIAEQPAGYDTQLGQMGSKLSGGQRQRIALARAILRDPSILILDEFTSQIDAESEAKIHQALSTFVRGRTTFLITHRLNSLEIADRIVVMDAGKVIAVGTHAQLMQVCPLYLRLHEASSATRTSEEVSPFASVVGEQKTAASNMPSTPTITPLPKGQLSLPAATRISATANTASPPLPSSPGEPTLTECPTPLLSSSPSTTPRAGSAPP